MSSKNFRIDPISLHNANKYEEDEFQHINLSECK